MLIATADQVYALDTARATPRMLYGGRKVQSITAGNQIAVCALEGGTILTVTPNSQHPIDSGIDEPIEALLLLTPDPLELLIGTVGPHIYRLGDDGGAAQKLESFENLACRPDWYTPWGGPPAVRSLARSGDWVYADIHVGSIMRSADRGHRWEPVTPQLHEDVHQVTTCPAAPQRVYANTADAVYLSQDCGSSWQRRAQGLSARYGRAIAAHPHLPDCLLASVSDGPHRQVDGRLFRSVDGGKNWAHVTAGFPSSTAANIDTFHLAFSAEGDAWAAVGSELFHSGDQGQNWQVAWSAPSHIAALSCAL